MWCCSTGAPSLSLAWACSSSRAYFFLILGSLLLLLLLLLHRSGAFQRRRYSTCPSSSSPSWQACVLCSSFPPFTASQSWLVERILAISSRPALDPLLFILLSFSYPPPLALAPSRRYRIRYDPACSRPFLPDAPNVSSVFPFGIACALALPLAFSLPPLIKLCLGTPLISPRPLTARRTSFVLPTQRGSPGLVTASATLPYTIHLRLDDSAPPHIDLPHRTFCLTTAFSMLASCSPAWNSIQ